MSMAKLIRIFIILFQASFVLSQLSANDSMKINDTKMKTDKKFLLAAQTKLSLNDISGENIKPEIDQKKEDGNSKDGEVYLVKSKKLMVTESPYSNARVLGTLAEGDTVKSIGFTTITDKFDLITKLVKINYKGQVGYVNSNYLNRIYNYHPKMENPDEVSIYSGLLFIAIIMFLGFL